MRIPAAEAKTAAAISPCSFFSLSYFYPVFNTIPASSQKLLQNLNAAHKWHVRALSLRANIP